MLPARPDLTLRVADRFPAERLVTTPLRMHPEGRLALAGEAVIVGGDAGTAADEVGLELLELPQHLLRRWHSLLGNEVPDGGLKIGTADFDRLAQATIRFLRFKQCALPTACVCSLETRRWAEAGPSPAAPPPLSTSRVRLAFNLGLTAVPFVFAGLSRSRVATEMDATGDLLKPKTSDPWESFRMRWPNCPVIRLDVSPGVGIALLDSILIHDRPCLDDGRPVIWLLIADSEIL